MFLFLWFSPSSCTDVLVNYICPSSCPVSQLLWTIIGKFKKKKRVGGVVISPQACECICTVLCVQILLFLKSLCNHKREKYQCPLHN